MIRVCLPDGTFKDFPSKAQAYQFISEMKEAYSGHYK